MIPKFSSALTAVKNIFLTRKRPLLALWQSTRRYPRLFFPFGSCKVNSKKLTEEPMDPTSSIFFPSIFLILSSPTLLHMMYVTAAAMRLKWMSILILRWKQKTCQSLVLVHSSFYSTPCPSSDLFYLLHFQMKDEFSIL